MKNFALVNKTSHFVLLVSGLLFTAMNPAAAADRCETKGANLASAERNAQIASCLIEASSPANIRMVALRNKKSYCEQNAKNKSLRGQEKSSYLDSCMNRNEALIAYQSNSQRNVASDVNKALRQSPTAAGGI